MDSYLDSPAVQGGTLTTKEFTLKGDFRAAYKYLKDQFEPRNSSSGPIKPLSPHEKLVDENKATAEMLKELPEQEVI